MSEFKPYKGNEEFYKELINKINSEINFPGFLSNSNYDLANKSASYLEFRNKQDKIVLKSNASPVTYFNRNDSQDNGLFFNYLLNRDSNFYKAIKTGLEAINRVYEINPILKTQKKPFKSLEENYNVTSELVNHSYLTKERGIDKKTLELEVLKGRVLNAYHINQNKSTIPNIAFPMYNIEGNISNYRLYNKDYLCRTTNEIKKFRIVLNSEKANALFHTNLNINNIERVYACESEIDAISLIELKKDYNAAYFVFGGGLSKKKKENFYKKLLEIQKNHPNISIIQATDNDGQGLHYDIELSAFIITKTNSEVDIEYKNKKPGLDLLINYKNPNLIDNDFNKLKGQMNENNSKLLQYGYQLDWLQFKDKIKWSIQNPKNNPLKSEVKIIIKDALNTINVAYNKIPTKILKPTLGDWNDDLKFQKKK